MAEARVTAGLMTSPDLGGKGARNMVEYDNTSVS